MSNPKRKMCTMRKVDKVTPIKGADRVEAVTVDGWVVVDEIGKWAPGEYALYFEPDTAFPTNDMRYSHMAQWGEKTMTIKGVPTMVHALKVRKLRGVFSQGYLAKPYDILSEKIPESAFEKMYENKARLDGMAGVCEYVPDLPPNMSSDFIGRYDPFCAPRTDAERIQNISQSTFDLIKRTEYFTSVKVDGTSITMCHDPRYDNRFRLFSHNNEFDPEKPGIGAMAIDCANEQGLFAWSRENPGKTIQGELCGSKIGGNTLRLKKHKVYVFSMWDMEKRSYVHPEEWGAVVRDSAVPFFDGEYGDRFLDRFDTPAQLIEWVNQLSGSVTPGVLDEGIVVHVQGRGDLSDDEMLRLQNALGPTMQMKCVSAAFLMKKKE